MTLVTQPLCANPGTFGVPVVSKNCYSLIRHLKATVNARN